MDRLSDLNKQTAECVGLWLAEGDTKTKHEITFTNNCWELIELFYKTVNKLFKEDSFNPRIYVYSKNKERIEIPYKDCVVKFYIHRRAKKPFFILRFASVKIVKKWKKIVESFLKKEEAFPYLFRGFFAGEGNVYQGTNNRRILRIAQKEKKEFIDNWLKFFNLHYSFEKGNRNYVIWRKFSWDLFAGLNLADLHPLKKEKFWNVYNSFKEEHYPPNYLIKEVYNFLNHPLTTKELAIKFKRSSARMQDVLILLKKQRKAFNFRIGSIDYWINDPNLIIISLIKHKYLKFLDTQRNTSDFAKHFKVCWKSSFNRLNELEKLNLVRREKNGEWIKLQTKKKLLVI